jgi:hypothetical protein
MESGRHSTLQSTLSLPPGTSLPTYSSAISTAPYRN